MFENLRQCAFISDIGACTHPGDPSLAKPTNAILNVTKVCSTPLKLDLQQSCTGYKKPEFQQNILKPPASNLTG